jgi:hypothetical protein
MYTLPESTASRKRLWSSMSSKSKSSSPRPDGQVNDLNFPPSSSPPPAKKRRKLPFATKVKIERATTPEVKTEVKPEPGTPPQALPTAAPRQDSPMSGMEEPDAPAAASGDDSSMSDLAEPEAPGDTGPEEELRPLTKRKSPWPTATTPPETLQQPIPSQESPSNQILPKSLLVNLLRLRMRIRRRLLW